MIAFACFFLIVIIILLSRVIWWFFEEFDEFAKEPGDFLVFIFFQVILLIFMYMAISYIVKWCGGDPSLFHML